jgi:hypothetical protein
MMISVLGNRKQTCDGLTRRDALTAGGLSLLGASLPDLLAAESAQGGPGRNSTFPGNGPAKNVILVYLFGGPPLHDTFDPKFQAPKEIRGEFGATATDVPGVHFCELLPQVSRWMGRSTLIRSARHHTNDHSAGLLYTMTGKPAAKVQPSVPILPTQAPSMNSVIEYLSRHEHRELPASVWMPCYTGWGQNSIRPGLYGGFLGRRFDPFITKCKVHSDKPAKYAHPERTLGRVLLPDVTLPEQLTLDRLERRRSLSEQFSREVNRLERTGAVEAFDRNHRRAYDLLTSTNRPNSPWRAFDVSGEPTALQTRYGNNLYGHSMLTARRLVEAGVRFVTVTWEVFETAKIDLDGWDTHQRNFHILRDHRLPVFDQAYSALCKDLDDRGLLDETLLLVMGEMGRTPKVNSRGGRDHWSFCSNILMTGAGVKQGYVHGHSDKIGAYPADRPVGPEALIATVYAAMGLDTTMSIHDPSNRPHPIAQRGNPVADILA